MNLARKPEPHPGAAAFAIVAMALLASAALAVLGLADRLDEGLSGLARGLGLEGDLRVLKPWMVWLWTVLMTGGICLAILHTTGSWRRAVLGLTGLLLTLCWLPVLALAGYAPALTVPLMALLWGGTGSMVYAARHREPEVNPTNGHGTN